MSDFLPISLPSRCLVYDGVNPEDIQIRPYTGQDEVFLAQINPINVEGKYLQVMNRVLRGIDPKRLTMGDRNYIILWEYINSYTNALKIKTVCTHCLSEIECDVDLMTIDSVELPENFTQPAPLELSTGETIHVQLITVGDEVEVEKWSNKGDALLYRYARSIVSEDDVLARMEKLRHMPAKDVAKIRAFHEKMFHGPDMVTDIVCPKCGEVDNIDVPFRFEFIFPDGEILADAFGA